MARRPSKRLRDKPTTLPRLGDLHKRHRGLSPAVCGSYAEAASVSLDRHHAPPISVEVHSDESSRSLQLTWPPADERAQLAWANRDDATEQGAYAVALASVEAELGVLAIQRAETRTGADYYVALPGEDMETAFRLEVAGSDTGDPTALAARLRRKVEQTRAGASNLPAIASVVGFRARQVRIRRVAGVGDA